MKKKVVLTMVGAMMLSTAVTFSGCGKTSKDDTNKTTTATQKKQTKKAAKKQDKIEIKIFKDNDQIKKLLSKYPKKLTKDQAVDQGLITIENEAFDKNGKGMWDQFLKDVKQKKDCAIIICQYTVEGDPILQYISNVNGKFYYVEDSTRDSYSSEKYIQYAYDHYKIYQQNEHYVAILTNDENMTFDEAQDVRSLKTAIQLFDIKQK